MSAELHSQAIEQVFDDLSRVARAAPEEPEFAERLVLASIAVTGAAAGGLWLSEEQHVRGAFQLRLAPLLADNDESQANEHLLRLAIRNGRPQQAKLPSGQEVLLCPVREGPRVRGVLELALPPKADPQRTSQHLETLAALAELAEDYFQAAANHRLQAECRRGELLDAFVKRIYRSLSLDQTAFEVANELPLVCDCERVFVLLPRRGRLRVAAVTGVDALDPRSESVVAATQLAARVAAMREPLWEGLANNDDETPELPPQLEGAVARHIEAGHPRSFAVLPLSIQTGERPHSVLVLDWIKASPTAERQALASRAAEHAQQALANAANSQAWPFRPAQRGWLLRQLPRLLVAVAVAALLAVFFQAQVPFTLEARGELQPAERREVFAPDDGVISRLFVDHGEEVDAGEPLLAIESLPLRRDLAQLEAQQKTLQRRAEALGVELLRAPSTTIEEAQAAEQLEAEEKLVQQQLAGVHADLRLVQQQLKRLQVASPLAGVVASWDVERQLSRRPVRRGQLLLRIDRHDGPWQLELKLPESRLGHFRRQLAMEEEVAVEFRLSSDPERVRRGIVQQIGSRAEPGPDGQSYLPLTVEVADEQLPPRPHPGATVTARVQCGKRARGFVWFHQLVEYVRQRLFV